MNQKPQRKFPKCVRMAPTAINDFLKKEKANKLARVTILRVIVRL